MRNLLAITLILPLVGCAILRDSDVALDDAGPSPSNDADADVNADVGDDMEADAGTNPGADLGPDQLDAAMSPDAADAQPADWWDPAFRRRIGLVGDWDRQIQLPQKVVPLRFSEHVSDIVNARELRVISDQGTVLPHYTSGADENLVIWAQVPMLEARTEVTVYWANPDALDVSRVEDVWSSSHTFVGHFEAELRNEVELTQTGLVTGDVELVVDGVAGAARSFQGGNIRFDDTPGFGVQSDQVFTFTSWIRPRSLSGGSVFMDTEGICDGIRMQLNEDGSPNLMFSLGNQCNDYQRARVEGDPVSLGEWHFMGLVVNRLLGQTRGYVDGRLIGTTDLIRDTGGDGVDLTFGSTILSDGTFMGDIDEPRIINAPRSDEWFSVEDALGRDAFFAWGEAETLP